MSGPADRLLGLMYEWMEKAKRCSSNLRDLAEELESLRKDCNTLETVGNTTAVAGSLLAICAAPFTGGGSLVLAGAVAGIAGTGVSLVTKIVEGFESSSKLKRVKEIDKRCNEIADEIQKLFQKLRDQCPSSSAEEMDKYVVKEFLKAMSKRSNLNIRDLDNVIKRVMANVLVKNITTPVSLKGFMLIVGVLGILSTFSLRLEGVLLHAALTAGGKQIGKTVAKQAACKLEQKLLAAAVNVGAKQVGKAVAIKGASRFLGGVVGLAFSLPEAIDSWTEAIKDKHETEASRSLRNTARTIEQAVEQLNRQIQELVEMILEALKNLPCEEEEEEDDEEEDEEDDDTEEDEEDDEEEDKEKACRIALVAAAVKQIAKKLKKEKKDEKSKRKLRMALINAQSVNKFLINPQYSPATLAELILINRLNVLLITETWLPLKSLSDGSFRSILPPNYSFINDPRFYRDRGGKYRGGGVAIVYSNELIVRKVDNLSFVFFFEYTAATVRCQGSPESVLILTIYRPPQHKDFLEELRELLREVFSRYRNVIIGGDFKVWVNDLSRRETHHFLRLLNKFGLEQHVRVPTRGSNILDLVISSPRVPINHVRVRPNDFSDHHTVFFSTDFLHRNDH